MLWQVVEEESLNYLGQQTKNCVVCGEPATVYTGHVHRGDETIIAGYCSRHEPVLHHTTGFRRASSLANCPGCVGVWIFSDGYMLWCRPSAVNSNPSTI